MSKAGDKKGKVVVISGPSGVGKGTICAQVAKRLRNVYISVSVTTRPKTAGETDGKDYWFVSRQQFEKSIKDGQFLEYAEVFGNFYGTPKESIENALKNGKIVILEIDVQGGRSVKAIYTDALMIFILPPDRGELARRLVTRGRDDAEIAQKRLSLASDEIVGAFKFYEYKVINDDLEQAAQEVINIIRGSPNAKGSV
jgi:guanylate kinase